MNKLLTAFIILITAAVLILIYFKNKNVENIDNIDNITVSDPKNQTMNDIAALINSSDDLKIDTNNYKNHIIIEIRQIFQRLDNNTDALINGMIDNKSIDFERLVKSIEEDDKDINTFLEDAYKNAKSEEYKNAYKSLNKYINLQNQVIYDLVEKYKVEKSISYDIFYKRMHDTLNLSEEEINGIQFLSGVDILTNENH